MVRKPVSITRLLQIALMVVSLCAQMFSTTTAVHAATGHHDGAFVAEAVDEHPVMEHETAFFAVCTSSEQGNTFAGDGLNCCSAMCSAAFLVEDVATATSDHQNDYCELPLQALTAHETHGLLRPPRI